MMGGAKSGIAEAGFGRRLRDRWRIAVFCAGVIVAVAGGAIGLARMRPESRLIAIAILILSAIPMLRAALRRIPVASFAPGSKSGAAESILRRVFEVSLDAIAVNRLSDGLFVEVNPEFARITGYERHELIGHTVDAVGLWVTPDSYRDYLRRLNSERSVRNVEIAFRRRDGSVLPAVTSSVIVELNGEPCVVSAVRDISESKRTEDELREAHRTLSEQFEALRENQVRLHESEALVHKVFEASLDTISVQRLNDLAFVDVNPEFERVTGISREQALSKSLDEHGLWIDPGHRDEFFRLLRTQGVVRDWEEDFRIHGGQIEPFLISAVVVELEGVPHAIMAVRNIVNVKRSEHALMIAREELSAQIEALHESQGLLRLEFAEREQAEKRLRESEAKLRKVFEASLDAVSIRRIRDDRLIEVNRECVRAFGHSREELLSRPMSELHMWGDLNQRAAFYREIRARGHVRNFESEYRTKDGRIVPSVVSGVVLELSGEPCVLVVTRDNTRFKQAERELVRAHEALSAQVQALRESQVRLQAEIEQRERILAERQEAQRMVRESEAKLRKVLDSSLDAIVVRRLRDDSYLDINHEFMNLTGYNRDEIIGHTVDELKLRPDHTEPIFVASLLADGVVRNVERMLRRKDGSIVPISESGVLLELDGEPCAVSIIRDITQPKKAEADLIAARESALSASEAKSEFLSSMSHEIRTPMNAILGMAQLLWETPLSLYQRRYLETMRANGDALLALIDNILDLAKVESGQLILESVNFELDDLVEKAIETLGIRAHEKGLELAARIAPDVPLGLAGDPLRLRQILINLLGNAIKFTSQGEVLLTVERDPAPPQAAGRTSAAAWLSFSISDTGIGIPAEKLATIFSSFTQADSSVTRQFGGTGLGLAIVKRLVEFHGGQIKLESQVGSGSTFSFSIPVAVRATETPKDTINETAFPGRRMLVVDDTEINRRVAREILAARGALVDEATGAEAALKIIEQARAAGKPYDLVLLDSRMPGASAFDIVSRMKLVRARDGTGPAEANGAPESAGTDGTPERVVLMLASDDLVSGLEGMRELGLTTYIVKPIRRRDLLEAASAAVGSLGPSLAVQSASPTRAGSAEPATPLKILLAEDSSDNRMLIRAYLKSGNYLIDEAENGENAIDKFMASQYDLVLMDIQMPIVDGYTAVRTIRQWEANHQRPRTPIIALTASAMNEAVNRSLQVGCDSHVSKPVKRTTLLEAIRAATAERRPEPAPAAETGNGLSPPAHPAAVEKIVVEIDADLSELIPEYLAHKRADCMTLNSAVERRDFATVAALGHRMKGDGGSYGFEPISEIGAGLMSAARREDGSDARRLTDLFADYLARIEIVFKAEDASA